MFCKTYYLQLMIMEIKCKHFTICTVNKIRNFQVNSITSTQVKSKLYSYNDVLLLFYIQNIHLVELKGWVN